MNKVWRRQIRRQKNKQIFCGKTVTLLWVSLSPFLCTSLNFLLTRFLEGKTLTSWRDLVPNNSSPGKIPYTLQAWPCEIKKGTIFVWFKSYKHYVERPWNCSQSNCTGYVKRSSTTCLHWLHNLCCLFPKNRLSVRERNKYKLKFAPWMVAEGRTWWLLQPRFAPYKCFMFYPLGLQEKSKGDRIWWIPRVPSSSLVRLCTDKTRSRNSECPCYDRDRGW